MKSNKNWVAVIPAVILYDRNLIDKDKLTFCVISNLTHEKGYCWASNRYIADLLNCATVTISRSIARLNKHGYIISSVEKSQDGTKRKIYLPTSMINGFVKNDKPTNHQRPTNNIEEHSSLIIDNSKELLSWINLTFKRKFNIINKSKLKARLNTFGLEQIKTAISNAYADDFHKSNNFKYLTPEYFVRNDQIIDKWLNIDNKKNEQTRNKSPRSNYTNTIAKEFGW